MTCPEIGRSYWNSNHVFIVGLSLHKGQATVLWDPATDWLGHPEHGKLNI